MPAHHCTRDGWHSGLCSCVPPKWPLYSDSRVRLARECFLAVLFMHMLLALGQIFRVSCFPSRDPTHFLLGPGHTVTVSATVLKRSPMTSPWRFSWLGWAAISSAVVEIPVDPGGPFAMRTGNLREAPAARTCDSSRPNPYDELTQP